MEAEPSRKLAHPPKALGPTVRIGVGVFAFFALLSPLLPETPSITGEKLVSAIETTQPAKSADPAPPLYAKPAQLDYRLLAISAAGGLIFSFFYLGIKFSRFRGLRVYRNRWSVIWLAAATMLSVIAAAGGQ